MLTFIGQRNGICIKTFKFTADDFE